MMKKVNLALSEGCPWSVTSSSNHSCSAWLETLNKNPRECPCKCRKPPFQNKERKSNTEDKQDWVPKLITGCIYKACSEGLNVFCQFLLHNLVRVMMNTFQLYWYDIFPKLMYSREGLSPTIVQCISLHVYATWYYYLLTFLYTSIWNQKYNSLNSRTANMKSLISNLKIQ